MVNAPNRVDIFLLALDSGNVADAHRYLAADEQLRAARIRLATQRERYVRARASLRLLLSHYLAIDPQDVPLQLTAAGKPMLQHGAGPHFNLSHSAQHGVIAVSPSQPVGIDIERLRKLHDRDALCRRHCSASERLAIERASAAERDRLFLSCWTRKEAWLKLAGTGITGNLQGVDAGLSDAVPGSLPATLHSFEAVTDVFVSVATSLPWERFSVQRFALSDETQAGLG